MRGPTPCRHGDGLIDCLLCPAEDRATEITAAVAAERERWRVAVKALVEARSKCGICRISPATHGYIQDGPRYCDACATSEPELPDTPALRTLLSMLEAP